MVITTRSVAKPRGGCVSSSRGACSASRGRGAAGPARAPPAAQPLIVVRPVSADLNNKWNCDEDIEAEDVIDLGAPRVTRCAPPERLPSAPPLRTRPVYTPNPRLYPGPRPRPKSKRKEARPPEARVRRRKRVFRRPVPNARLYRPAPPRPSPVPLTPRAAWPPPAPPRALDTASRAALRFAAQRRDTAGAPSPPTRPRARDASPRARRPPSPPPPPPSRRLVVTLPSGACDEGGDAPRRYRPASEHFRLRSLDTESGESSPAPAARRPPAMETGARHSTSPEDCSDGNDTLSAPSEFLAEFLSAIMRRQYAEALKYCRLILQYEPHNATARGFYPLLQHKVQSHTKHPEEVVSARGSSSGSARSLSGGGGGGAGGGGRESLSEPMAAPPSRLAAHARQELMEQEADESESEQSERSAASAGSGASGGSAESEGSGGSCGSQSSLELDSSEALAHSSPSPSLSLSRRTDRTDHTDSASGGCWESTGSASRSEEAEGDDNGNAALASDTHAHTHTHRTHPSPEDVENDNAAAAGEPRATTSVPLKNETSSLRRLRAQFACSIK